MKKQVIPLITLETKSNAIDMTPYNVVEVKEKQARPNNKEEVI
jgi:hypothetical protein